MADDLQVYLLKEYEKAQFEPTYITIHGKEVLIPCDYVCKSQNKAEYSRGIDKFKSDFFNHTDENNYNIIAEYEAQNLEPKFVWFDNVEVPVPMDIKYSNPVNQKTSIFNRCNLRYINAVKANQMAKSIGLRPGMVKIGVDDFNQLKKEIIKKQKEAELAKSQPKNLDVDTAPKKVLRPSKSRKLKAKFKKALILGTALTTFGLATWLSKCSSDKDRSGDEIEEFAAPRQKLTPEEQDKRFEKFANELLGEEGGYATKKQIDQETHYGVINSTLESFKDIYPEHASEMPKKLKDLTKENAKTIIRVGFYDQYKIGQIENDLIAEMILDITYNHSYKTMREFVKEGLNAVITSRGQDTISRPKNWIDIPEFINECTPKERQLFYKTTAKARHDMLSQPGYIKEFRGLLKRAGKFCNTEYKENSVTNKDVKWAQAVAMAKGNNSKD